MLITLVGMPASGKTTTGKCLAKELRFQFRDLDHEIEKHTGKAVPLLFQEVGEARFREIEREVLLLNLHHQDTVLALGGGTPCFGDNMEQIVENSLCVYILSDLEESVRRICAEGKEKRPMFAALSEADIYQKLENLLEQRYPFYAQAHVLLARGL